ncbi:MAG: methyltransferase domain-containing protein [Gammaproteobacteria bacterium]|nr:methyltransferase domain-containing protein [Gammaproteobacteria bacterium]
MNISSIPIITVSYNTPELVNTLIGTLRQFYQNKIYIIDGSENLHFQKLEEILKPYKNIELTHFDYNIHHGPGMAWAINNLDLNGPVLIIDSDVIVEKHGFIEALAVQLKPGMYGVGHLRDINRDGFNLPGPVIGSLKYLQPALMLCNIEVLRQWPMPVKHGAPLIEAMLAIHDANRTQELLENVDWLAHDFSDDPDKNYIIHDWQGTVDKTGGYHLEEWMDTLQQRKQQPPPTNYNPDLLSLIPSDAKGILEIGCGNGALANAYKEINPNCQYFGIDSDGNFAESANMYCDGFYCSDVEQLGDDFFKQFSSTVDTWVFGDSLEYLKDPDKILNFANKMLPKHGSIIACIPNSQHWSLIAKLCIGDFRYEDSGLLEKNKLRFYTRATIFELFEKSGFTIEQGFPRVFNDIPNDQLRQAIQLMATSVGANPEVTINDAIPTQYIIKAVPI